MGNNPKLAQKLKGIVEICEAADAAIEEQNLIKRGALAAGKENDGIEPAVVRKILARRKRLAKDPAETARLEDLMTDYQFMLGEGRGGDARPWTQTDDEVARVVALTNTDKPPKIETIKKALGCSQGKAHKLRTLAATRLAKKSSSSRDDDEHEHSPPHDPDTGEVHDDSESTQIAAEQAAGKSDDHRVSRLPDRDGDSAARGGRDGEGGEGSEEHRSGVATQLRAQIPTSTDPGRLEREAAALEGNEIHRGATQPKGCAKVVRTDASMSESVAASGDAIRDASAMPLDVVAAPHSEGREHAGSAATAPPACSLPSDIGKDDDDTGTHSGGDACTESCGPCPVSSADGAEKGNGLPSAKGKAEHASPAARRHTSDDALAPALGTSQCEDGASPGPHDAKTMASPEPETSSEGALSHSRAICGYHSRTDTCGEARGEARPSLEDAESTWFSTLQRSRQEGRV